ncbi:hypothetical protein [Oceanobacillus sojae]|uniref:hypothetical protein n=1 Tax=Oceanobacillus sojae TaxID=582851 RepID=UPI0036265FFE
MDYIYWWEENYESGLKELHSEFLSVFEEAEFIPAIYNPILYKYYHEINLKHWDRKVMKVGNQKLIEIKNLLDNAQFNNVLLQNLNLLASSFNGAQNISRKIELMNNFKGSMELKASLFLINIYNDLLNGPYSKILQLYIKLQGKIENKVLDQKTLRQQMQCLSSRKYDEILNIADADIRNAMSHDGVEIQHNKIQFTYRNGKETVVEEHSIYEVKDRTISLFDSVNGLIMSCIRYLIENKITFDDVYDNNDVSNEVIEFYERLSMSTLEIECKSIEEIDLHKEQSKQVNVVLKNNNLDIPSRFFVGIHTAGRVYGLRNINKKDRVMISFESDKTINSFIRVTGDTLEKFVSGEINEEQLVQEIKRSEEYMLFPVNKEQRNKYEDLFRYYTDIENEDFVIREIEDISNRDKKRFRAVVYVKNIFSRKHVEKIIFKAVNELRKIKNYGFTNHLVKHGDMEVDVLYLVIYKKEVRKTEQRTLMPSNKNFLVQIQYDKNKQFDIKNPLIDRQLHKKIKNTIEYNWNPNFYKFG